ncbi:hypothetical protein Ddye_013264 [Dipteronia dyeriana]|uniref:DUF4283 domain-containing protein n=1 Tax=Dipteronia dyeriana TaxID=168575 RepID=A0AAD9X683_9ROSI|nr:hypothetical protein Ddye_013264 [Dipteronia dyeriana]
MMHSQAFFPEFGGQWKALILKLFRGIPFHSHSRVLVIEGKFCRRPWCFDRALLVLEEPIEKGDIHGMSFNRMAFWVQIRNVPLICMTVEISRFLGEMIREVRKLIQGNPGIVLGSISGFE